MSHICKLAYAVIKQHSSTFQYLKLRNVPVIIWLQLSLFTIIYYIQADEEATRYRVPDLTFHVM